MKKAAPIPAEVVLHVDRVKFSSTHTKSLHWSESTKLYGVISPITPCAYNHQRQGLKSCLQGQLVKTMERVYRWNIQIEHRWHIPATDRAIQKLIQFDKLNSNVHEISSLEYISYHDVNHNYYSTLKQLSICFLLPLKGKISKDIAWTSNYQWVTFIVQPHCHNLRRTYGC
jgi:hypothetical protein